MDRQQLRQHRHPEQLQKRPFGPWLFTGFKVLAKLKGLRGTVFDVFGNTQERKMERALIGEYTASIDLLLKTLNAGNHATAVDVARIPELIKGYGHVKERHLKIARLQWAGLMKNFLNPVSPAPVVETARPAAG